MIYQQLSVDAAIAVSSMEATAAHVFGLSFYFSSAVVTMAASSEATDAVVAATGFGL
ncbi:MAG: hypothetical protein ACI4D8_08070 [Wujia sp.]